jgi:hypothetical protein
MKAKGRATLDTGEVLKMNLVAAGRAGKSLHFNPLENCGADSKIARAAWFGHASG